MNREEAYLYDLFLTPGWRELYDRLVEQEFTFPKSGRILDLEAGTGGYAVELAVRGGAKTEVVAVTADPELQMIATEKARIGNTTNVRFLPDISDLSEYSAEHFCVAITDQSLSHWRAPLVSLAELSRLVRAGGTIISKLLVKGSFDEFFSIFWEALYELDLLEHWPKLERLIIAQPELSSFEEEATAAGLHRVRGVTSREVLTFADANEFLTSPLIRLPFLPSWLGVLPDEKLRKDTLSQIAKIIDRQGGSFEVSIRAALLIAQR
ncbi:MAG: methyltransferase domain-containing protein [Blastocatellia bacterium]